MKIEVVRLYLGSFDVWGQRDPPHVRYAIDDAPFHGYAIKHPQGVVLVDTGLPTSLEQWPARSRERRMIARSLDHALADHGLSIVDVAYLINTHLDIDHCGQNVLLQHVPVFLQERELERAKRIYPQVPAYFDWMNAQLELLNGDAEILPGLHALSTPGHTEGHQSVLVAGDSSELIVGDAVYTADLWEDPDRLKEGHPLWVEEIGESGQIRTDYETWRSSLDRLRSLEVDAAHLCHSPTIFRATHRGGASVSKQREAES